MNNTYHNGKGKYQTAILKLEDMIPEEGSIKNVAKNKCLERLRKACNCYHDFYNNGLGNLFQSACRIFDLTSTSRRYIKSINSGNPYPNVWEIPSIDIEAKMDKIVEDAAREQNIPLC